MGRAAGAFHFDSFCSGLYSCSYVHKTTVVLVPIRQKVGGSRVIVRIFQDRRSQWWYKGEVYSVHGQLYENLRQAITVFILPKVQ